MRTRGIEPSNQIVNASERPRILVVLDDIRLSRFDFLKTVSATVKFVRGISEVDLDEWDCVVVDRQLAEVVVEDGESKWVGLRMPHGLQVFYVHDPDAPRQGAALDAIYDENGKPVAMVVEELQVPGVYAKRVNGLPDDLQSLVQKELVPLLNRRQYQFGTIAKPRARDGVVPPGIAPLLVGPAEIMLAAVYDRAPGSNVWMVPFDLADFEPWFLLALESWHDSHPDRFPGAPRWIDSDAWRTQSQVAADIEIAAEVEKFRPYREEHEAQLERLAKTRELATTRALDGELRLLTAQGEPLQSAVHEALTTLGFEVEDMDAIWDERERREDFRVRDPDAPSWVSITEVTGVAKGVKGAKLQLLSRHAAKYILESRPETTPAQWLIVNHFIGRDPENRGDLLRGDELKIFAASDGLAVDTAALFELVRAAQARPDLAIQARKYLRESTGQIRLRDARAFIAEAPTP